MSNNIFRPMLATDADLGKLRFPLLASAKLDGVRAVVRDGVVYSRSNKPIPNAYVQQKFSRFEHFDGELIVGDPTSKTWLSRYDQRRHGAGRRARRQAVRVRPCRQHGGAVPSPRRAPRPREAARSPAQAGAVLESRRRSAVRRGVPWAKATRG